MKQYIIFYNSLINKLPLITKVLSAIGRSNDRARADDCLLLPDNTRLKCSSSFLCTGEKIGIKKCFVDVMSRASIFCPNISEITVVGNGPLTKKDKEEINASACVLRFNDSKNMQDGDKCDAVAIRSHILSVENPPENVHSLINRYDPKTPIWPIFEANFDTYLNYIDRPTLAPSFAYRSDSSDKIFSSIPTHDRLSFHKNAKLFEGCSKEVRHDASPLGPSTGGVVLDELQKDPQITKIQVYGMNWSGSIHHVDFDDPDIVPVCCTKCEMHETKSRRYLP